MLTLFAAISLGVAIHYTFMTFTNVAFAVSDKFKVVFGTPGVLQSRIAVS